MYDDNVINDIKRLNFEELLSVIFIVVSILNILGESNEKKYLKTKNNYYKNNANKIFELTIIITLFIYIYFFIRNYDSYKKVSDKEKKLYSIKLLSSCFLIAASLCLLYFQEKQNDFEGTPAV